MVLGRLNISASQKHGYDLSRTRWPWPLPRCPSWGIQSVSRRRPDGVQNDVDMAPVPLGDHICCGENCPVTVKCASETLLLKRPIKNTARSGTGAWASDDLPGRSCLAQKKRWKPNRPNRRRPQSSQNAKIHMLQPLSLAFFWLEAAQ